MTGKQINAVRFEDVVRPENACTRMRFEAVISGYFENPFLVPREVRIHCDRKQKPCPLCPVITIDPDPDGTAKMTIPKTSEGILHLAGAPEKSKRTAVMRCLSIPDSCRVVRFVARSHYSVHDVRISPVLSLKETHGGESLRHPALAIDAEIESNVPYEITGIAYPRPSDQQAVVLVDAMKPSRDNLDSYAPTEEELEKLKIFQPEEWTKEALEAKITKIYEDFAYNVTGIFERRDLHLVADLCWHSVLLFEHEGRTTEGWVNALILGDTAHGKSEIAERLLQHYALGERVDCKNATAAGVIGGLQQIGTRWFISWGSVPRMDRQLCVLEEVHGFAIEEIARMTDMRSSGVAAIGKIEKGKTNARTRLLWIGNTRDRRKIAEHSYPVDAIGNLIGAPEDVRRFDIACIVADDQIPASVRSTPRHHREAVEHELTPELSRALVLFAWTRGEDQVIFSEEVETEIRQATGRLSTKFGPEVGLIDIGTTHRKLARLACSLAARTFSVQERTVIVRKAHVQVIEALLNRLYDQMGYSDLTGAERVANSIADPEVVSKCIKGSRHPKDVVRGLLRLRDISMDDVQALWEIDRESAQNVLSLLQRKHCLKRMRRGYRMSEAFIALLKSLELDGLPEGSADLAINFVDMERSDQL